MLPPLAAAVLASALPHCGASPPPRPANGGNAMVRAVGPRPPPPDTSPVAAPTNLAATVRVPSPAALAERLGALTGQPALVTQLVDQFLETYGTELAAAVDRNAPVDAAVMWIEQVHDVDVVVSFGAPGLDRLENLLGQSYRFVPVGNGVVQLEPVGAGGGSNARGRGGNSDDQLPPFEGSARNRDKCVVAPTAAPGATRVVCGGRPEALEAATPYLSRTLARTPGPADAVRFEVVPAFLRTQWGRDGAAEVARARGEFDAQLAAGRSAITRDPTARDALLRLGHDVLESAQSFVENGAGLRGALALGEQRAQLHVEYDLPGARGELLRGAIASVRAAPAVPPELLAHLLPDGWLYSAGAADLRELRGPAGELRAFLAAAFAVMPGVRPPDRAALQTSLALLDQLDPMAAAVAVGHDPQGQPWMATTLHSTSIPATQVATAIRAVLAAMRRPGVLAMLRRERVVDPGDLRELPARGLPAGAFGFRLPRFSTLLDSSRFGGGASSAPPPPVPPPRGARATGAPRRGAGGGAAGASSSGAAPMQQVLVVPMGQDLVVLVAPDAPALFTRYQAAHAPAVDPQVFGNQGAGTATIALVPAGLPSLLRAGNNPSAATGIEQLVNGLPDRGRTPVVVRAGASDAQGATQLRADLELGAVTIRAVMGLVLAMRGAP